MDTALPATVIRRRNRRRILTMAVIVTAWLLGALAVSRLQTAVLTIDRSTVWIDAVKRGLMIREVRGLGTLVPEQIRWIPSTTDGRVERILIQPGSSVRPDSVILELSNPELENQV